MRAMDNPARLRRRLTTLLVVGLLLVLPSALALQTTAPRGLQPALLAMVGLGALLAVASSAALTWLNLRSLRRPALGEELHDELSVRNAVRSMAVGYAAAVAGLGIALPIGAFVPLPMTPLLTFILLVAVVAQLGSFAWLERQGDE
jgi:hypothetical protein